MSAIDLSGASGVVELLLCLRRGIAGTGDGALGRDLIGRIDADLCRLGHVPPPDAATGGAALHPVAVDYVLLGSRMGTEVLRRQLPDDARDLSYFRRDPEHVARWRALTDMLSGRPASGADADRIVADARRAFALFDDNAVSRGLTAA